MGSDRRLGRGDVEPVELAADWPVRVDPPQHQVRVGHGGTAVAEPVAGRSRIGARGFRAHLQKSARIDPGDRAAPGADRGDLDHRRADHHAEIDRGLRGQRRLAIGDQRDIEGGAAHVAGDHVLEAGCPGDGPGRDYPGGGTRERRSNREPLRGLDRHHAAVRLHDQHVASGASGAQRLFQPIQIARYQWLQIGVQDRSRDPLELTDLRDDLGGRRNVRVGPEATHRLDRLGLVRCVGVAVDEEDGDRLAARLAQGLGALGDLIERHLRLDRAIGQHPFVHLQAQVARHDGLERAPEAPGLRPVAAAHLEHVAETRGRDDAGPGALALEKRVGADGGAVDDRGDVNEFIDALANAVDEALGLILAGRGHLCRRDAAPGLVPHKDIGEGSAHIDANDISAHVPGSVT